MTKMEPYRVGALADLISSQPDSVDGKKKAKKSAGLTDLFTSKLPPVLTVTPSKSSKRSNKPDEDDNASPKKKKLDGSAKKVKNTPNKKQSPDTPPSQQKPKTKAQLKEFSDDEDEMGPMYTRPSLKHQVKMEDSKDRIRNPEEESRTVFVGNLPVDTTEKTLKKMFKAFGEIESLRFRGAARPDAKTTKKIAIIKRTVNEKHQRILAYIRFKDIEDARKSCTLNGTELNDSVIRVDMADGKSSENDYKKAIFIGNLRFTTEEDDVRKHFDCCGPIESVRLIRDSATGMGKGFGYVNFASSDSVEAAIQRNGTELLGRAVRVGRSVRKPKATLQLATKVKKSTLGKKKPATLVNQKVVKVSKKKVKEAKAATFQGQKAEDPEKSDKKKKKKNKGEAKKKMIAKKFANDLK